MSNIYNFYCDESHYIQFDGQDFMVFGAIYCLKNKSKFIKDKINLIKAKHGFTADYELKWTKVNYMNYECIKEIFKYIYLENYINICILIAKGKNNLDLSNSTYDDWYHKMYYYLLKHPIDNNLSYKSIVNLFIDKKDSYSNIKYENLSKILMFKFSNYLTNVNAKACDSKEYVLIQIIDIIIGLVSYNLKNEFNNSYKKDLLKYFKNLFQTNFLRNVSKNSRKVNCFIWKPETK